MTHPLERKPQTLALWLAILLTVILTACAPAQAQADPAFTTTPRATIELTGDIAEVMDLNIVVNSLIVLITDAQIDTELVVGNRVHIEGILLENGQIQALEIDDTDGDDRQSPEITPEITPEVTLDVTPEITPEVTPEAASEMTPTSDDDNTIIVIEGPVQAININIIVIYDFEIVVDEDDLALTVLQIGDVIRVEGLLSNDDDDDRDDIDRIRLISVNITFVSVTVVIIDGLVWRDTGSCSGIPNWIPEDDIQIVLIRCRGGGNPSNSGNSGGRRGSGGGGGGGGDDDD